MAHISVLLHESIEALALQKNAVVVDGTFGRGGHTKAILDTAPGIHVYAFDKDETAILRGKETFKDNVTFVHSTFSEMRDMLATYGVQKVDAILLDIGFSSDQLEGSGRGFSFKTDEPLLMTLGTGKYAPTRTAMDVVSTFPESDLIEIIENFGEERHSKKIARAIVDARKKGAITTTFQLNEIIDAAVGKWYRKEKIHPSTRTFQALRIYVNDELGELSRALDAGINILNTHGRFAVITFHSLEDRIVKNFFKQMASDDRGKIITKKPIVASDTEIESNPRSRSAKLRIVEKM